MEAPHFIPPATHPQPPNQQQRMQQGSNRVFSAEEAATLK